MKEQNVFFPVPIRCSVREEYYEAGKTGICFGWVYHQQYWAIVVWDNEEDPTTIKLNALKFEDT